MREPGVFSGLSNQGMGIFRIFSKTFKRILDVKVYPINLKREIMHPYKIKAPTATKNTIKELKFALSPYYALFGSFSSSIRT